MACEILLLRTNYVCGVDSEKYRWPRGSCEEAQRASGAGTMETTVFGVVKDVAISSDRGPLFELRGLRCVRISASSRKPGCGVLGPGLHLSYCRLSLSTYAHPWRPLGEHPSGLESLNLRVPIRSEEHTSELQS